MSCRRCHAHVADEFCARCEARIEFEQNRDDELEIGRPPAATSRRNPFCFLAQFSSGPCEGRLVKAHLLPRSLLKREFGPTVGAAYAQKPASYAWACGGTMGNSGHHGMLDTSRTLRIPRSALPAALEHMAADLGLVWWLEREYGPLEEAA